MLGQPGPRLPPGATQCLVPGRPRASVRTTLTRLALAATAAALTVGGLTPAPAGAEGTTPSAPAGPARVAKQLFTNPVTPGNFTGLGFDQCHAPEQYKMDAWLAASPFRAVGIYISGASRGCRDQPNLTPTWISTQLANGWRLLPITLGPQANCHPRVPALRQRPGDQRASSTSRASTPRRPARAPPRRRPRSPRRRRSGSCRAARCGTTSRGTTSPTPRAASPRCGSSAPGPSSCTRWATSPASTPAPARASSRSTTPGCCGRACSRCPTRSGSRGGTARPTPRRPTSATDGWRPGGRMKQFQGGHNEKWGGVTINIDRNYLDLHSAPRPRRRSEPLPRHPGRPGQLPAAQGAVPEPHAEPRPGHRAQVPAEGAGRLPRPASRAPGPSA